MAPVSVIKKQGIDAVMKPIVEDIKKLEEGVKFNIGGQEMKFYGTIAIISADNLASQMLGGYKQLNSALRRCRFCMVHRDDMDKKFTPTAFQPRTRQSHARHVAKLGNPALASSLATTYGLTRDSVLNTLKYFHIVDGLPPDIMHDVLEGGLQYELKEMLRVFTQQKKYFSLCTLNKIIHNFSYGYTDSKNKPAEISLASVDNAIGQEAAMAWCLARLLPIMIGEKIPEGDEHWKNYLDLLTIMDHVFAPTVSPNTVALLHDMIRIHHEQFHKLYPECSIIPKLHYMIHIPEWILKIGPLSRHWCMRFEAKHAYFKRLARNAFNFKNIAKTLAKRHQRLMCYHLNSVGEGHSFLNERVSTGKATPLLEENSLSFIQEHLTNMTSETSIFKLSRLEVNAVCYKERAIVILSVQELDLPIFGEIKHIVVVDVDRYFLLVSELETLRFNAHFHAYEVAQNTSAQFSLIQICDLEDHNPLSLYACNGLLLVPLKYYVVSVH